VHIHLTYATILAAPIARLQGKRVVVSLHNTHTARGSSGGWAGLRGKVLRLLETASLSLFVDHVVFVGDKVAAANLRRIGRVPATTVRNVIAPPKAFDAASRAATRAALGAGEGEVVVIATGRLSKQKDPLGLLRAFSLVQREAPDARLWLVGDGPLRGDVEALCDDLDLCRSVRIFGERGDVADLLEAADIFVLASAWEGLPLGLLEALAHGLPVVATEVGDVPQVVTAEMGMLTAVRQPEALASALTYLATHPGRRQSLGVSARRGAAAFADVAAWYCQLQALYRS
jgi:glycosyltransferase involved in cell wall biosynthesis